MRATLRKALLVAAVLFGGLAGIPVAVAQRVDLALVLAADVSASIDDHRFWLQREGYAAAVTSRDVLRAVAGGRHGVIALTFVEFAGAYDQKVVIDWTVLRDAEGASLIADILRTAPRSFRGATAIGAAIDFIVKRFAASGVEADRYAIDVSGDGTNNNGRGVVAARDDAVAAGITVNGLAVLADQTMADPHTNPPGGLVAYYRENVIGGPAAFVMAAEDTSTFARAIRSKLVKEIAIDFGRGAAHKDPGGPGHADLVAAFHACSNPGKYRL